MKTLVSERRTYVMMAALLAALVGTVVLLTSTVSSVDAAESQMVTCQDNSACALYPEGGWMKVNSSKASGGTYHVSRSTTKPALSVVGTGPEVAFVTATGPKRGTALVGAYNLSTQKWEKVRKFDLRAESSHYKVVKRITGLQQGQVYALAVVSANGKPVVVDAFKGFPLADGGDQRPPPPPGA